MQRSLAEIDELQAKHVWSRVQDIIESDDAADESSKMVEPAEELSDGRDDACALGDAAADTNSGMVEPAEELSDGRDAYTLGDAAADASSGWSNQRRN